MQHLTVGADPEVFLKMRNKPSPFVRPYGVIPGNKKTPFPVKDGAIQVDGMALEFNIDPASSANEFTKNINTVLSELKARIPIWGKISVVPIAMFSDETMRRSYTFERELGCDPDWNAYTEDFNIQPYPHPNMRTAAGHIHVGWEKAIGINPNWDEHIVDCFMLAIQMDYFLGLPSLIKDPDKRRREMYGQPGSFRPKEYGMEYRTLSNFWLRTNKLKAWVFNATTESITRLKHGDDMGQRFGKEAAKAIQSNNVTKAIEICKKADIRYDF